MGTENEMSVDKVGRTNGWQALGWSWRSTVPARFYRQFQDEYVVSKFLALWTARSHMHKTHFQPVDDALQKLNTDFRPVQMI